MNNLRTLASALLGQFLTASMLLQSAASQPQLQSSSDCEFFRRPINNSWICLGLNGRISDSNGYDLGAVNKISTREDELTGRAYILEWVIEEGNLIKYSCDAGFYGHCQARTLKEVYIPER